MISTEKIKCYIMQDASSKKKKTAKKAQDYYESRHDILEYRIFYINRDGKLIEDVSRSNIRISHPFFTELVDQQVQYMLSGGLKFTSKEEGMEEYLKEYFDDQFIEELQELLEGTIIKGFDYLYCYKNKELITRFKHADGMGVVEVKENGARDTVADYIIHYYPVAVEGGEQAVRVEIWEKELTTYYIMGNGKELELDPAVEINPLPHILYKQDNHYFMEELGYLPIFRLDNNQKQISGLQPIKDIIDDYDLMDSGLSNNLQDINEGIFVIKGYEGDDLDELQFNVRQKKMIGVGEEGDLDIKTINIPYEARRAKMEIDESNIYRFGMGFNSAQTGDGNITNIVIRSRYGLLDLKSNKLEIRMKSLLRQLLNVVVPEINERYGKSYHADLVEIKLVREIMTNAIDNASIEKTEAETMQLKINTILYAAEKLDDETVARQICNVMDIDFEEIKSRLPELEDLDEVEGILRDGQIPETGGTETTE